MARVNAIAGERVRAMLLAPRPEWPGVLGRSLMDLLAHADGRVLGWRIGRSEEGPTSAARLPSPVGTIEVRASARGVVACRFVDGFDEPGEGADDGPAGAHARRAAEELREYFDGRRRAFGVPLDLRGTPFQLEAWRVLCEIPFGAVISYAEQAARMGRPEAARAVGRANAANPIAILVPCHRVVASTGRLHGYAGGLERKRALLSLELGEDAGMLAPRPAGLFERGV